MDCLTDLIKPIYAERALIDFYVEEGKELTMKGEEAYFVFNAIQCRYAHNWDMSIMERNVIQNAGKGSWKPSKKYCKIMKVQKKVIAHVKQCYDICHEKARQTREDQKYYQSLLHK